LFGAQRTIRVGPHPLAGDDTLFLAASLDLDLAAEGVDDGRLVVLVILDTEIARALGSCRDLLRRYLVERSLDVASRRRSLDLTKVELFLDSPHLRHRILVQIADLEQGSGLDRRDRSIEVDQLRRGRRGSLHLIADRQGHLGTGALPREFTDLLDPDVALDAIETSEPFIARGAGNQIQRSLREIGRLQRPELGIVVASGGE